MSNERVLWQAVGLAIVVLLLVGCGTSPFARSPGQSEPPSPRGYQVMAYDAESDRIIVFGGVLNPEEGLNDTWAFDAGASIWQDMSPAQSPPMDKVRWNMMRNLTA